MLIFQWVFGTRTNMDSWTLTIVFTLLCDSVPQQMKIAQFFKLAGQIAYPLPPPSSPCFILRILVYC